MILQRTTCIITPIGELWLSFNPQDELYRCDVTPPDTQDASMHQYAAPTPVVQQLASYFTGTLKQFTFRFVLTGTQFQHQVWEAAMNIPFGEICTYRELASQLGSPNAARAVGNALAANPLLIVVPCHRVVPTSGGIGGYRGGRQIKEYLLDHEARISP